MPNKTLQHVGVLGMKWGKRRASGPPSADHTTAAAIRTKKLHEMSNSELKTVTARLQLEKSYKDLSKTQVSAGQKYVSNLLGGAVAAVIAPYATQALKTLVEKTLASLSKSKS